MPKKEYQPNYKPSLYSDAEKHARLGSDLLVSNREVERVAQNIANAMNNPDTPAIVRAHIKAYLSGLFDWDMPADPKTALVLYPLACRRISQIPFVPSRDYIEALTANDKTAAIKAALTARLDRDDKPFESVTHEHMKQLVETVLKWDNYQRERNDNGALALIALMHCLTYERSFHHRWAIADTAMRQVFTFSSSVFDPCERFIEKAVKLYGGGTQ